MLSALRLLACALGAARKLYDPFLVIVQGLDRLSHAETSSSLAKGGGILGGYTHEELHGFTRDLR